MIKWTSDRRMEGGAEFLQRDSFQNLENFMFSESKEKNQLGKIEKEFQFPY